MCKGNFPLPGSHEVGGLLGREARVPRGAGRRRHHPSTLDFVLITMGLPRNPKRSRMRFCRKRSKAKCSLPERFVKTTKVGGATPACVR